MKKRAIAANRGQNRRSLVDDGDKGENRGGIGPCPWSDYLQRKREWSASLDQLASELFRIPKNMLEDGSPLDCTSNSKLILDYATSLTASSDTRQADILKLCLRRLQWAPPKSLDLDDLEAALPLTTDLDTALAILQASIRTCSGLVTSYNEPLTPIIQEQIDRILDPLWNRATDEQKEIFWAPLPAYLKFNLRGAQWRDRAIAHMHSRNSRSAGEFLLEICDRFGEDVGRLIEEPLQLFLLHPDAQLHSNDMLARIYRLVIGNATCFEYCLRLVKSDNPTPLSGALALLFWKHDGSHKRKLLETFSRWNILPPERLTFFLNVCRRFQAIPSSLVLAAAQNGLENLVSILMMSSSTMGGPNDTVQSLVALTTAISAGKEWAWPALMGIPHSFLRRHLGTVKVIIDYLDRLSFQQIVDYYTLLLFLEDPNSIMSISSLSGDLAILFGKQVANVDDQIRTYGACALIALLRMVVERIKSTDLGPDEATCSQAPRFVREDPLTEFGYFMTFFDTFLTCCLHRANPQPLQYFSQEFTLLAPWLPKELIKVVNRKVSRLFEKTFIVELSKHSGQQRHFNLDGDEALIGIELDDYSTRGNPANLSPLFELVQTTEKILHHGALDSIDALLGCPILLNGPIKDLTILTNWFITLVNAFHDQEDQELQEKCLGRLAAIVGGASINVEDEQAKLKQVGAVPDDQFNFVMEMRSLGVTIKPLTNSTAAKKIAINIIKLMPSIAVILKYIQYPQASEYLQKEAIRLELWNNEQLKSLQEKVFSLLDAWNIKLRLLEEMQQRSIPFDYTILESMEEHMSQFPPAQVPFFLRLFLMVRPDGVERLINRALDYIIEKEWNSSTCESVLQALGTGSMERLRFISEKFMDTPSLEMSFRVALIKMVFTTLPQTNMTSLESLGEGIKLFEKIVNFGRRHGDALPVIEVVIKHSRLFLKWFSKHGLVVLQKSFLNHRSTILDILKDLQMATRSLHILGNHVKASKGSTTDKIQTFLPPLRKSLEGLLFGVKGMLQAHGCLTAFWMGNLKHRSIDGAEVDSQIHVESVSSSEEDEEEEEIIDHETSDLTLNARKRMLLPKEQDLALSKEIISDSDSIDKDDL